MTPFGSFGASLGCLWGAFGRLWADFGLPLAPFGSLWGALGLPLAVLWSPFGRLGAPVGSLWGVFWNLLKIGRHFPRKMADITAPAHKNKPPVILPRLPAVPPDSPEVVSGTAARTPPPHAPGVRMT